jgi:hypothetical protein
MPCTFEYVENTYVTVVHSLNCLNTIRRIEQSEELDDVLKDDIFWFQLSMYVQVLINLTNEAKCNVDITVFKFVFLYIGC